MLCGWESDRRSSVALAMRHRLSGLSTYGLKGQCAGDEHPTYAALEHGPLYLHVNEQESSAKLTNQRVSYAFTSSPFSFYARHSFPTFKFRIVILVFYLFSSGISEQHELEL